MSVDPEELLARVDAVLGDVPRPVSLHEPTVGNLEVEYLAQAVRSGWVSSVGPMVEAFEESLCELTGLPHSVVVSTGTAALHLALLSVGVRPDDEVMVPDITFIATANAVAQCGAVPHILDVESAHLSLDTEALGEYWDRAFEHRRDGWMNRKTGRRLGAVVVVHVFGHIAPPHRLATFCNERGVPLVEDAAEAIGSTFEHRHAGSWGDIATLSFNGNKVVTTGGGGAVVTRRPDLAQRVRHLATTAKVPHRWAYEHDSVGFNYRMPNLLAAVGIAQLERLPKLLQAKRVLARKYDEALRGLTGVRLLSEPAGSECNYWLNALVLDDSHGTGLLDRVLEAAWSRGVQARPLWGPVHTQAAFRRCPSATLTESVDLASRVLCLPSSPALVEV